MSINRNIVLVVATLVSWLAMGGVFYFNNSFKNSELPPPIDSTLVTHTIAEKSGAFEYKQPQPIVVVVPGQQNNGQSELVRQFKDIKDDQIKLQKYIEAITNRLYEKTYEDSTVRITIQDSVQGYLKSQKVNWTIKPQKLEIWEKSYHHYPKFVLSAGTQIFAGEPFEVAPIISFKNKKNWNLDVGYSTQNRVLIGVRFDLIKKYD